jgi:lysophospholipase L1-like esterase
MSAVASLARRSVGVLSALVALVLLANFAVTACDAAPPGVPPILRYNEREDAHFGIEGAYFRPDDGWLFDLAPGAIIEGDVVNEDGLRGPRVPLARGDRPRVALLGESMAFGAGLPDDQSLLRVAGRELARRDLDVEMVNLSVPGHTASLAAIRWVQKVHAYRPDLLVLAFGQINDALEAPSDLSDVERLVALREPGVRVTMLLERLALVRWLRRAVGVAERPSSALSRHPKVRCGADEFEASIDLVVRHARANGAEVWLLRPPRSAAALQMVPALHRYDAALDRIARRLSLREIHLSKALERAAAAGLAASDATGANPYFRDAFNLDAAGHHVAGLALADEIARHGDLPASRPAAR